jgi:hypothetical protein
MSFNDLPDPEMIAKSAAVSEVFTPEKYAYLLTLIPTPQSYVEIHERYEASYAASLKADPEKVKACEADRQAINQDLSILHALAKAVAVKDPTVPESLGLDPKHEKAAPSVVTLTAPRDFKVVYTPEGKIIASVTRVEGAKGYQVWACDSDSNAKLEENWRLAASSSNCKKIEITGLTRGKSAWLKVRAMRGNTAGPWSNYVSL